MNDKLKAFKLLSSFKSGNWKIGKSDDFIRMITNKVSSLPPYVFNNFSMQTDPNKKISIVDFTLMTYDMDINDRRNLMSSYSISQDDIENVLDVVNELEDYMRSNPQMTPSSKKDSVSKKASSKEIDFE